METIYNAVKVKFGITAMELVKSLMSFEVTVTSDGSEYLSFVIGRLHIA